jgi:replicative DNA helicase
LNNDLERGIILSIIFDARLRDYALELIEPDFFNEWENRYLYTKIQELSRKKEMVNFASMFFAVQLDSSLKGSKRDEILPILERYKENPDSIYLKNIRDGIESNFLEEVKKTILKKGTLKLYELTQDNKISEAYKLLSQMQTQSVFNKPEKYTFDELLSSDFTERITEWGRIIPTGITGRDKYGKIIHLDDELDIDGIPVGAVMFISGISGGGKSTFMLNVGLYQSLRGYNADYYTLELPMDQLSLRTKSILLDIPSRDISKRMPKEETDSLIQETLADFPDRTQIEFYKSPPNTVSLAEVRRNLYESEKKNRHVDTLIVDYLDLMKPPQTFRDRKSELDAIGYGLKEIAQEYGCSVITASQSNRGVEHKNVISRFQSAGSFAKVEYSNLYITINDRNPEFMEENGDGDQEVIDPFLFIDKSTFGRSGFYIFVDFNKETGRFWNILED